MQIQQNPMDQQIMEDPTLGPKFERSSQNHNFYSMVEQAKIDVDLRKNQTTKQRN